MKEKVATEMKKEPKETMFLSCVLDDNENSPFHPTFCLLYADLSYNST